MQPFIAGLGNIAFEHFAFMVGGTPEVMHLSVDLDVHFIKMPFPMGFVA